MTVLFVPSSTHGRDVEVAVGRLPAGRLRDAVRLVRGHPVGRREATGGDPSIAGPLRRHPDQILVGYDGTQGSLGDAGLGSDLPEPSFLENRKAAPGRDPDPPFRVLGEVPDPLARKARLFDRPKGGEVPSETKRPDWCVPTQVLPREFSRNEFAPVRPGTLSRTKEFPSFRKTPESDVPTRREPSRSR